MIQHPAPFSYCVFQPVIAFDRLLTARLNTAPVPPGRLKSQGCDVLAPKHYCVFGLAVKFSGQAFRVFLSSQFKHY